MRIRVIPQACVRHLISGDLARRIAEPGITLDVRPLIPRAGRRDHIRFIMAAVLVAGILTIPVNCAMAAGPHSIFQDPAASADANGVIHLAHQHTSPAPAEWPAASPSHPFANQLPAPTTAISVLVAVADTGTSIQLPQTPPVPGTAPEAPLERSLVPDPPPPRG